jgi:hypothetical protein
LGEVLNKEMWARKMKRFLLMIGKKREREGDI